MPTSIGTEVRPGLPLEHPALSIMLWPLVTSSASWASFLLPARNPNSFIKRFCIISFFFQIKRSLKLKIGAVDTASENLKGKRRSVEI